MKVVVGKMKTTEKAAFCRNGNKNPIIMTVNNHNAEIAKHMKSFFVNPVIQKYLMMSFIYLTHSTHCCISNRKQSFGLQCKSND